MRQLTVTGTDGIIDVEHITQEVVVDKQDHRYTPYFPNDEPLRRELTHFLASIQSKTPVNPSGADGLQALRVCEAALQSAKSHHPVQLSKA